MALMYKNIRRMASATVEDYLKRIYVEQAKGPRALVPMGVLAESMGVAPGTATSMGKTLADSRLVRYEPYAGVRLTRNGRKLALGILRRHRVIEFFLVEALGMDWVEVHEEAERLEHALSDRVLEKMDAYLGHPGFDPHGDPIPAADGRVEQRDVTCLCDVSAGSRCCVARITDQSPVFLRAVERLGLLPGTEVRLQHRDDEAGTVEIAVPSRRAVTVAYEVAERILVELRGRRVRARR